MSSSIQWDPTTRQPQTIHTAVSADAYRVLSHITHATDAPVNEVVEVMLLRVASLMDAGVIDIGDLGFVSIDVMAGAQRFLSQATEIHQREATAGAG